MQTQRGAHVLKTSGEQVQVLHDHGRGRVVDLFALRRQNLICPRCGGHIYYKLDDPAQATKGE